MQKELFLEKKEQSYFQTLKQVNWSGIFFLELDTGLVNSHKHLGR